MGSPSDYGEIFLILAQRGVIDGKQRDRLVKMAGFRNILVHGYLNLDRAIVYDNLSRLEDFEGFQEQVLRYLEKHSQPNN